MIKFAFTPEVCKNPIMIAFTNLQPSQLRPPLLELLPQARFRLDAFRYLWGIPLAPSVAVPAALKYPAFANRSSALPAAISSRVHFCAHLTVLPLIQQCD